MRQVFAGKPGVTPPVGTNDSNAQTAIQQVIQRNIAEWNEAASTPDNSAVSLIQDTSSPEWYKQMSDGWVARWTSGGAPDVRGNVKISVVAAQFGAINVSGTAATAELSLTEAYTDKRGCTETYRGPETFTLKLLNGAWKVDDETDGDTTRLSGDC
ncbi:MAG TPA: hypothetical protein VKV73_27150 [Chloroflexota bacterium]|nr:hypothetical protein [Chloroflexota bacterium]